MSTTSNPTTTLPVYVVGHHMSAYMPDPDSLHAVHVGTDELLVDIAHELVENIARAVSDNVDTLQLDADERARFECSYCRRYAYDVAGAPSPDGKRTVGTRAQIVEHGDMHPIGDPNDYPVPFTDGDDEGHPADNPARFDDLTNGHYVFALSDAELDDEIRSGAAILESLDDDESEMSRDILAGVAHAISVGTEYGYTVTDGDGYGYTYYVAPCSDDAPVCSEFDEYNDCDHGCTAPGA